jgi:hypothetical protein
MLYFDSMNRIWKIALVGIVILLVLFIFVSPSVDLQPTALRAQLWLSLIVAMFSLASLFSVFLMNVETMVVPPGVADQHPQRSYFADLSCCLLC